MTKTLGLIGFPLGHSFSQRYFTAKFKDENIEGYQYKNFPIETTDSLPQIIAENPDLVGFNVTIPHKLAVIEHLSEIDQTAKEIGAVNCVAVTRNSANYTLKGYNTDFIGFRNALTDTTPTLPSKALVLGTGGASRAVTAALDSLSIEWKYLSRTPSENTLSYEQLNDEIIDSHKLIINCTPLGMYPKVENKPNINYDAIGSEHLLFDLIFNPNETQFMAEGRKRGATVKNGYQMLLEQAEAWWSIIGK